MADEIMNGYRMHYEVFGQGPALVMIHGGLGGGEGSAAMVENHASALGRHFNVVFYDRRGAGKSETPAEGYLLNQYCEDLHALLEHLEIPRAHILGSSAGGPIAIQFALDHPEMTQSLLLINTMSYNQQSERAVRQKELDDILANQESAGAQVAASEALESRYPGLKSADPERFQTLLQINQDRVEAIAKTIQSYLDIGDSLESRLSELAMPTLIVHGDADSRIPLMCGQQLQAAIASSELYVIPGAEHGLLTNEASHVRGLVLQFLERITTVGVSSSVR